jgi:hypothetical protein
MKSNSGLANSLIIGSLALLMGCVGLAIAARILAAPDTSWKHQLLPIAPSQATRKIHVKGVGIRDPTGDTIYITTKGGEIYSNTLFDDKWVQGEPAIPWKPVWVRHCVPTWDSWIPGVDDMLEPPPVERKVLDSAGVTFGHAMVDDVRCYVLYDDGSIEVWGRELHSVWEEMPFVEFFCGPAAAVLGALIGILIGTGIVAIRHRRSKNGAKAGPSTVTGIA